MHPIFLMQKSICMRNDFKFRITYVSPDIDSIQQTYHTYCSLCSLYWLFKSGPLPRSPSCKRVIYVCRVIVWSHTVSLFPKEKPVIVRIASNYRAAHIQWILRSFAKCFVKLDSRFHGNDDFPASFYTLFHRTITIKIMTADKATTLELLAKERRFRICMLCLLWKIVYTKSCIYNIIFF